MPVLHREQALSAFAGFLPIIINRRIGKADIVFVTVGNPDTSPE